MINNGTKVIPRETGRVTYSTEIRNLKKIGFSEYQKAIIIGTILGDGCLCENWSKTNYRLLMTHSVDQKDYILWKYSIFKQWILSEPRFYERTRSLTIRTISHPGLTTLRKIFYEGKTKIIPKNIFELMKNPITLAVWFMDDGNKIIKNGKLSGYHLNTQSFTYDENKILANTLEKLYGIDPVIEKNKNGYRLSIQKKISREIFRDVIDSFILASMKYKFG